MVIPMRSRWVRLIAVMLWSLASLVLARPGLAWHHTFRIVELHSSRDGLVQYIRLAESFGLDHQCFLTGHQLTSTQGETVRVFTFPYDLRNHETAHASVLIATPGYTLVTPDYIVPAPFLFPMEEHSTMPESMLSPIRRSQTAGYCHSTESGATVDASPVNFSGQTKWVGTYSFSPPSKERSTSAFNPGLGRRGC